MGRVSSAVASRGDQSMHKTRVFLLGAVALLAPLGAAAQPAQTAKWVNLRAGPARDYPLVLQLPPAAPLAVQGCLSDFSWCDVIAPGDARGWVYGGNLIYPYQNAGVPVIQYGAVIGIPVVTFVITNYWGSYYRHRPWYRDRWQWSHRPPRPRPSVVVQPPRPRPPPQIIQPPRPMPPRPVIQPPRPQPPRPIVQPPRPVSPPSVRPSPVTQPAPAAPQPR